jgi:phosphomannomutase
MIDRVAEKAGIKMIETPVGFKYLAQAMLNEGAVLGAEESGGLGLIGKYLKKMALLPDYC